MPTIVTSKMIEKSTAKIDYTLYDATSAIMAPNSLYWTLADPGGVAISSGALNPVGTGTIVLSSNDLRIDSDSFLSSEKRYLILHGNYDSSYGSNLSLRDYVAFDITNLSWVE